MSEMTFRSFQPADQAAVRMLVLQGLGEHFGCIDETMNPDMDDVNVNYIQSGHLFILAEVDGQLAGTGALKTVAPGVAQMVRVSVCSAQRRRGIGRAIVTQLVQAARQRQFERVLVETNNNWSDAIGLYRSCGFHEYARDEVSVYMVLEM